jgi:HNH endonuclease
VTNGVKASLLLGSGEQSEKKPMNMIQPTKRVRLKVVTDGKAPKGYGDRVYKIGKFGGQDAFLRSHGWTVEKEGRAYSYMRPPASEHGKPPFFIDTAIPTREEVLLMAEEAHREGAQWLGRVGEWPAYYAPSEESTMRLLDNGSGITPAEDPHTIRTEPRFEVGVWPLWKAHVHFQDGAAVYGEDTKNITRPETGILPFGGWLAGDTEEEQEPAKEERGEAPLLPEKVLRAITDRRGQTEFRAKLLVAYGGRCAITQCDAEPALEAAHILGYAETGSQAVTNGLLLRADIHTLFDTGHIRIDPETMTVVLSAELASTCYQDLAGRPIVFPARAADKPSKEALQERWLIGGCEPRGGDRV